MNDQQTSTQQGPLKATHIALVIDKSGSMGGIRRQTVDTINSNIETIKSQSTQAGDNALTTASLITFNGSVNEEFWMEDPTRLRAWTTEQYRPDGSTALLDAIGKTLTHFKSMPDADSENSSFLVLAITDGEENSSIEFKNTKKFLTLLNSLQDTERFTVAVMVPRGYKAAFCKNFGVPDGNVTEWEATIAGSAEASRVTTSSVGNYLLSRSSGVRSTRTFFANVAALSTADVAGELSDITATCRSYVVDKDDEIISDFCARVTGRPYVKGSAYYELVKSEEVQRKKKIVIMDAVSGKLYSGTGARRMLGIDVSDTIHFRPGNTGKWRVFVESTSYTRKLKSGTTVVYTA